MSNIKFSGLKGQALAIKISDIPSMKDFKSVIPDHYFNPQTIISLGYLLKSTIIQLIVVAIGLSIPFTQRMIPIWILYAFLSGTKYILIPNIGGIIILVVSLISWSFFIPEYNEAGVAMGYSLGIIIGIGFQIISAMLKLKSFLVPN